MTCTCGHPGLGCDCPPRPLPAKPPGVQFLANNRRYAKLAEKLDRAAGFTFGEDYGDDWGNRDTPDVLSEAVAVSSRVSSKSDRHIVAIDLDVPALLVPSTTPGHSHLYIDVEMDWDTYENLLGALVLAGIVESGYVSASIDRQATVLRTPWTKKR